MNTFVDFIDCAFDSTGEVDEDVADGVRLFLKCCGMHTFVVPLKVAKNKLFWGTYGIPAEKPVRWIRLIDCPTDHLFDILKTQPQLPLSYRTVIKSILDDRHNRR